MKCDHCNQHTEEPTVGDAVRFAGEAIGLVLFVVFLCALGLGFGALLFRVGLWLAKAWGLT